MGDAPVLIWKDVRWSEVRERLTLTDFWRKAADTATEAAIASNDPAQRDRLIHKAQEHLGKSLDEMNAAMVLLRGPGKNE